MVEIGPGRGALTDLLRERAGRLVAVELDGRLAARLRERYATGAPVEIVERDVLAVSLGGLGGRDYLLAGNVPYYITTPILFHALASPRPARAVFLVQSEVAERVAAPPGSKTYGALSVNVQALAAVELVFRVAAGAFSPPPTVESAVVRLVPLARPAVATAEEVSFQRFVVSAFALRRKQLRRVVRTVADIGADAAAAMIAAAGLDPEARPEVLSPGEFATLFRVVYATP